MKKKITHRKKSKKIYKGAATPAILVTFFAVLAIFLAGGMFLSRNNNTNPGSNNTQQPVITITQINTAGLFPISGIPNITLPAIDTSCKPVTNDVIIVIDHSGSMKGDKLKEAKEAAKIFTELVAVNPASRVGLVIFDRTSKLLSPLTEDVASLKAQIDKLKDNPYTCIQCGIITANKEMKAKARANTKKSIILLSDGKANYAVGKLEDNAKKAALIETQKGYKELAVSYYTIAVGKDAEKTYMKQIASLSGGLAYAPGDLAGELEKAFTQTASDICK